jgi:hypothetical protein
MDVKKLEDLKAEGCRRCTENVWTRLSLFLFTSRQIRSLREACYGYKD